MDYKRKYKLLARTLNTKIPYKYLIEDILDEYHDVHYPDLVETQLEFIRSSFTGWYCEVMMYYWGIGIYDEPHSFEEVVEKFGRDVDYYKHNFNLAKIRLEKFLKK